MTKNINKTFLVDYGLISLVTFIVYLIFLSYFDLLNLSYNSIVFLSTTISVIGIYLIFRKKGFGFSVVYLMYLSLAHLGTVTTELIFPGAFENFRSSVPGWFNEDNLYPVVHLIGISIYFFLVGSLLWGKNSKKNKSYKIALHQKGNSLIFYTGLFFITLYLGVLIYGVLSGLISIESYSEYRDHKLPGYVWFLFLFRIGIPFCFATGNIKQIRIAGIILIITMSIIFVAGSRGEVIYPLAIAITILIIRGMKIKIRHLIIFVLIFFLVLPVIAQTRGNFTGLVNGDIKLNLTDPFVEAGVIIRPYAETYHWIDSGEDLAYGKTYWIPVQRILGYLPNIERPKLEGSRYFLKERTPTQGYSTLAESYFNFGLIGIILFPILISFIIKKLTHLMYISLDWLAYAGGLLVILMANIRGHFLSVPAHIILLSIIFFTCIFYYEIRMYNKAPRSLTEPN